MSDIFIPSNPVDVVFRPLTGGMISDGNPAIIPDQAQLTLDGYRVTPSGPKRRPAWTQYAGGTQTDVEAGAIISFVPAWKTDGNQFNALLTAKYLYNVGTGSIVRYNYPFSTGTLSLGGTTVKASSGLYWSAGTGVLSGDFIVLSATELLAIERNDISTMLLASTPTNGYSTGTTYVIRRTLHPDETTKLDATVIDNKVVIADGTRTLYVFTGTVFSNYLTTASYIPGSVVFFKNRLWITNTIESAAYNRQRIRWSGVAGDPRVFGAADYLDLPYGPGEIVRLVPMGNLLIAYFGDAIWYGVPTNLVDLPFAFDRVETANVGLVGPYAVCPANGGHYFVGQDNIYFLPTDPRQGPVSIGDPILGESLQKCTNPSGIYVVPDPVHNRVLFGFPQDIATIQRIFSYNYITKTWSYESVNAEMLANPLLDLTLTWDDLATALSTDTWNWISNAFNTWDAIGGETSSRRAFRGYDRKIYENTDDETTDTEGDISATFVTKEIDLAEPNVDKTYLRLTVAIVERPSADLVFAVSGSDDGGNSWTSLGNLTIASTERKNYLDFTFSGASVRFRLVTTSQVEPFTIASVVVRVSRGELEADVE